MRADATRKSPAEAGDFHEAHFTEVADSDKENTTGEQPFYKMSCTKAGAESAPDIKKRGALL